MVRPTGFVILNSPVHPRPELWIRDTENNMHWETARTRSRPKGCRKSHRKESEQVVCHVRGGRAGIREQLLVVVDKDTSLSNLLAAKGYS